MNIEPFIVENAGNTCYIDSILMALFFTESHFDRFLNKDLKNTLGLYLQEYIKTYFVEFVRGNKSIVSENMEMIRNLSFQLGWKKTDSASETAEEYTNQQDVSEFYSFLMEVFENTQIEIQRDTISEGNPDKSDNGAKEIIPFIPLSLPEKLALVQVKQLLNDWLYDNISDLKRNTSENSEKQEQFVKGLNIYNIINTPQIIALSINRFNNKGIRIETDVIIQKKIIPSIKKQYINKYEWVFHAAVCHRGLSSKSGHYYSLVTSNNKWFIFDDLQVPCLQEVSMNDKYITDLIKKECVFLLYRLI